MFSDQFYWASRVATLGLGAGASPLTTETLSAALTSALAEAVIERARGFRQHLRSDGATVAARRLVS